MTDIAEQSTHSPDAAKAGAEIDGLTATNIVLSLKEICAITGYKTPTMQLGVLRKRGYYRAVIGRKGVVLTRTHFDAVESGQDSAPASKPKVANLSHLRPA